MTIQNVMPCPQCGASIEFDVYGLIAGQTFRCGKCHSEISLSSQSVDVVSQAVSRYESLRKDAGQTR